MTHRSRVWLVVVSYIQREMVETVFLVSCELMAVIASLTQVMTAGCRFWRTG